jgi:hypothetical protein
LEAALMHRLVALGLLASLAAGCSSRESDADLPASAETTCSAQCSELSILGSLVELSPASRSVRLFTRLAKTNAGWVVAWHDEAPNDAYLQRIDADGVPTDAAFRVQNADVLAPHWDGTSTALWARLFDQNNLSPVQAETLAFASFDGELTPLQSVSLSGPEVPAGFVAYDVASTQAFAYWTGRVSFPIRQLRILPGPILEQRQHFLERAAKAMPKASLAWTSKQLAATYLSAQGGYLTTFLDPASLTETTTVDLGTAGGETPQDIQSAMGDSLLWIAVWQMSKDRLWLRAIDVSSATPLEPISLPWHGTLTSLFTAGDTPLVISRPGQPVLGQLENDAIVPIDTKASHACRGTRLGGANVVDLELTAGEGAALLDDIYDKRLYFARVRCQ